MLLLALFSALVNLVVLVAIPLGGYFIYHKLRHKRTAREIFERAGLRPSERRYLGYSLAWALLTVAAFLLWHPSIDALGRDGSAQSEFVGLDLGTAIPAALLYGVVKTGFAEEFLFRGLIAGSLSRRLSLAWANFWQALVFLLPHLLILAFMPELWMILPIVFGFALFAGWLRIRSGSIVGPWLIHATANVTTCLYVAVGSS